jgi:predicted amidohydrolase
MLQTDIRWLSPDENIREAQRLIGISEAADLYVLPEMWSTGFTTDPQTSAHDVYNNSALDWMVSESRRRHCAICGSLAVRLDDGSFRNRHYFADGRSDSLYYYDKHHLFSYGHENVYYTPGQEHVIVSYEGFRFLLLICYDLRFPNWSRYTKGREYDAIILVANWPDARQAAWHLLTRARAIENQCYFIGVNRVGYDRQCHYTGASVVVDPIGRTLGQCRLHVPDACVVAIDRAELQRRREKFRVLDDADE